VGLYTSDTDLSFTGTAPYIVTLKNEGGTTQPPITVNSNNYVVPSGATLYAFTDATGAPGMLGCIPSTTYTLVASAAAYCTGSTVTFALSNTTSGRTYWLYKDTEHVNTLTGTSGAATFTGTFAGAGVYTAQVIAENGYCAAEMTGAHTVSENPLPAATVTAKTICSGGTAALAATLGAGTTTPMTYTWNIGGTPSTTTANSKTSQALDATTTYTVRLTNSNGCIGNVSAPATMTVHPLPAATATAKTICSGETATLVATLGAGTTTPMTYTWNIGGTTSTTTANSKTTDVLTATTTYTVQLSNANGCAGNVSAPATITVHPLPAATATTATVCYGQSAILVAILGAGTTTPMTYTWNIGGTTGTTTANSKTTDVLMTTTTYTVQLRNSNGCVGSVSAAATITVNPLPAATVTARTICSGGTAALAATLGAGTTTAMTYTWNIGGTPSTTTANSKTSQALDATTTYTVQLRNSNGCVGTVSAPATITVNYEPTITLRSGTANQTVNAGSSITPIVYSTTYSGVISGSGFPTGVGGAPSGTPAGTSYTISGTPSATGTFGYSLTATTANCTSTAAGTITVNAAATTPPNAASTNTWVFGSQTWSDAIHISSDCNKSSFTNDYDNPQCRSDNSGSDGKLRYYYNWAYVNANAATLCPSSLGWRVPSRADFMTLVNNTNVTYWTLYSAWDYGGYAYDSYMFSTSSVGMYWSSTSSDIAGLAYYLDYTYGALNVVVVEARVRGFQVRCVKD
jgi:uncharacterized protein (TIGR02145 family)